MIRANDDRLRKLILGQERLMEEVHGILRSEEEKDDVLRAMVRSSRGDQVNRIARLDPDRVFSLDTIRDLCVRFGLRFLDARHFKGSLPPRALYELRRLESRADAPLRGFKVMAPAARFKLCDSDADPLLFIAVGPEHYYLVHKWGSDLSPWRTVLTWPWRGPLQLALCVLLLAMLCTALLPNRIIGADPAAGWWGAHRLLALLWTSMVFASFTAFGWLAFFGKFSKHAWNDHRFN